MVKRIIKKKRYIFTLSVYHGVNGESLGRDTPCRGYLGNGGEFRCGVRPGSGYKHKRLDETTGGPFSLLRHEGPGGRHGIVLLFIFSFTFNCLYVYTHFGG